MVFGAELARVRYIQPMSGAQSSIPIPTGRDNVDFAENPKMWGISYLEFTCIVFQELVVSTLIENLKKKIFFPMR